MWYKYNMLSTTTKHASKLTTTAAVFSHFLLDLCSYGTTVHPEAQPNQIHTEYSYMHVASSISHARYGLLLSCQQKGVDYASKASNLIE